MSERQEKYKNEGKFNELRRRRTDAQVELRKSKQENKFSKKRNMNDGSNSIAQEINAIDNEKFAKILERLHDCPLDELEQHVETIRLKLSFVNPPLDLIIKYNVIPILVQCLTHFNRPNLQFRATWAITNIASSDYVHTKAVVDCHAVPHLINLVRSDYGNIATQAVWALGNITGDCAHFRDFCVRAGYVDALLPLITSNTPLDNLRTYSWALSNLCRYKDPPPMQEVVLRVIPYLQGMLISNDNLTIIDALWALTYISDVNEQYIPIIVESDFIPMLKSVFNMNIFEFYSPLIRIFGNISSHKDHSYTQTVIDCGMLHLMIPLINSTSMNFRKETIWFLSNLAAGTHSQIQAVINTQSIPLILSKLVKDKTPVKNEACWVFRNILAGGTSEQMLYILQLDDFVSNICHVLKQSDILLQADVLKCIYAMMCAAHKADVFDKIAIDVETCDGLTLIEDLQYSKSLKVSNAASGVIKKHFASFEISHETDVSVTNDAM